MSLHWPPIGKDCQHAEVGHRADDSQNALYVSGSLLRSGLNVQQLRDQTVLHQVVMARNTFKFRERAGPVIDYRIF
jgi:hypothetical protein